jgi:hypothetical protein
MVSYLLSDACLWFNHAEKHYPHASEFQHSCGVGEGPGKNMLAKLRNLQLLLFEFVWSIRSSVTSKEKKSTLYPLGK